MDYFSVAIEMNPTYSRAYVLNAKCHWYVGEFQMGIRILERALEYERDDCSMILEYARHLMMLGLYDKAEMEMNLAEKVRRGSTITLRALLHALKGEIEETLSYVQDMEDTHNYIVTCIYSELRMDDEAIENIKRGIELDFKEVSRYLYGYLLLQNHPCYIKLHNDPRFVEILNAEKIKYERRLKMYGDF
jgi:tetratricopeptide (TPR) repeat protein